MGVRVCIEQRYGEERQEGFHGLAQAVGSEKGKYTLECSWGRVTSCFISVQS